MIRDELARLGIYTAASGIQIPPDWNVEARVAVQRLINWVGTPGTPGTPGMP